MARDVVAILIVIAILIILVLMLSKRNAKDLKALKDHLNSNYHRPSISEHGPDPEDVKGN